MIRATQCERGGAKLAPVDDEVELDFDQRWLRRIAMVGARGTEFLLDLERPMRIKDGDALLLEDGRRVGVLAAAEPLAEVRCADLRHLVRVAWHLGNRHLPVMLEGDCLLIRADHVIEDMVRGLGAEVRHVSLPFQPEGGAYAAAGHGHHHHHGGHEDS